MHKYKTCLGSCRAPSYQVERHPGPAHFWLWGLEETEVKSGLDLKRKEHSELRAKGPEAS